MNQPETSLVWQLRNFFKEKEEALIRIEEHETHVVCDDSKSNKREIIRQCILSCVNTF